MVELVEYSTSRCPKSQANIVSGWVGRILDNLLETGSSHPWIEQYLQGWLQQEFAERLSSLLEKGSDKVGITAINGPFTTPSVYPRKYSQICIKVPFFNV